MRFTTRTISSESIPCTESNISRSDGIPYFPPPPRSAFASASAPATKSTSTKSRPSRLTKSRQFILPLLLIFTFIVLVLGFIYAYCVAKPHTQLSRAALQSNTSVSLDSSIFSKRVDNALNDPQSQPTNSSRSVTEEHSTQSQTALYFYTATLPTLSLVHLSSELILHNHKPSTLATRTAHIVILTTTLLLVAGWITTTSFWLHCELPNRGNPGICPAQVRGHFMYGIHELSIAKGVIAWVIVLLHLVHAASVSQSMKASRRAWALASGHGEAQEVVVSAVEGEMEKGMATTQVRFVS